LPDLSILIPSRNEMFLAKTIENVLANIEGDTEIIAVCDGHWPDPPVKDHPRVALIYHSESIGQRAATNEAAKLSQAKFIMKLDAHCAVAKGFDVALMADCEYDWTVMPRGYNLHAFDWVCKVCGWRKYQGPTPELCENEQCANKDKDKFERDILWKRRKSRKWDFMRFDQNLKFAYWGAFGKRPEAEGDLAPSMSLLGAAWMMHRERYWDLDGCDEAHGSWGQMGTEIACKSWLSGGQLLVNKKTWFAHMFRTQGGDFGFPYTLKGRDVQRARKQSHKMWKGGDWPKAKYPLSWLIDKFKPVPDWHDENGNLPVELAQRPKKIHSVNNSKFGLVYYTDNRCEERILRVCRQQIERCLNGKKYPIVSVSQFPIDFGHNIVMPLPRCVTSLYKQVLQGLEASDADYIYLIEHDLIYHPSHFEFVPPDKKTFWYNRNRWALCADTGKAVFYHTNVPSLMVASRKLLIKHYSRAAKMAEETGARTSKYGYSPPRGLPKDQRVGRYKTWLSAQPCIDIRHGNSFTRRRMDKSQFRSERSCRGWTEADEIPGWGKTKDRFDEFIMELGVNA